MKKKKNVKVDLLVVQPLKFYPCIDMSNEKLIVSGCICLDQILVGSSMGGLIMLHAAMARPTRMHALVGVSAAADMPQRRFSNNYPTVRNH